VLLQLRSLAHAAIVILPMALAGSLSPSTNIGQCPRQGDRQSNRCTICFMDAKHLLHFSHAR
jgi:hypothetical protein